MYFLRISVIMLSLLSGDTIITSLCEHNFISWTSELYTQWLHRRCHGSIKLAFRGRNLCNVIVMKIFKGDFTHDYYFWYNMTIAWIVNMMILWKLWFFIWYDVDIIRGLCETTIWWILMWFLEYFEAILWWIF